VRFLRAMTDCDDPLWLEAVKDLNAATVRMEERAREIPGRYFIFASEEQKVLVTLDTSPRSE
jgi:hypothetical protein